MRFTIRHIPFIVLLLPLLCGILSAYFASLWLLIGSLIGLGCGLYFWLYKQAALSTKDLVIYVLILLLIGYFASFHTQKAVKDTAFTYPLNATFYQVQLTDYPAPKANSVLCNVKLQYMQDSCGWQAAKGNIKLYLHKDSLSLALRQGDILVLETHLRQSMPKNPEDFDYSHYLRLMGYSATGYVGKDSWIKVTYEPLRGIRARAIQCRNALYNHYQQAGLHGEELAIVSALTLGYTEDMDTSTRQSFSVAGAAHILAVSGLHTGIIYWVLCGIFTLFGLFPLLYKQRKRTHITMWIIIILLWFYAFLAGLTPSILRSVLMLSILSIGKAYYFRTNTYNILAAAAFIELVLYPLHLFTTSFILSYSAVLAIVYLQPRLGRLYTPTSRIGKCLWDLLIVSLVAQIGTLPWTLYFFGQTSNYFALTNLTILPLSYVIMLLAVLTLLFSTVPGLGSWCAFLLEKTTAAMLWGVQTIEHWPYATTHWQPTGGMVLGLIILILSLCLYGYRKHWAYLLISVVCIAGIVGLYAYQLSKESQREQLIAFSSRPHTTLLYQQGRACTILTNDSLAALRTTANYRRYHYLCEPTIQLFDTMAYSFQYKDQNFLLIDNPLMENKTLSSPLATDVLLLGNIGRVSISRLRTLITAKEIIALPTLSNYKTHQLYTQLMQDTIPFNDLHIRAHKWE